MEKERAGGKPAPTERPPSTLAGTLHQQTTDSTDTTYLQTWSGGTPSGPNGLREAPDTG
jgi:hypothetical protein